MPLNFFQIAMLVLSVLGSGLIAGSFSKMAIVAYKFYTLMGLEPVYVPRTKILLYPLLIALGGFSFLYFSFTLIVATFVGFEKVAVEYRFLGSSATFIGSLISAYAMYKFYKGAKNLGKVVSA